MGLIGAREPLGILLPLFVLGRLRGATFKMIADTVIIRKQLRTIHNCSVLTCAHKCSITNKCRSFNYDTQNNSCVFTSKRKESFLAANKSWNVYIKDSRDATQVGKCTREFYDAYPNRKFCDECEIKWKQVAWNVCIGPASTQFAAIPFNQTVYYCGMKLKHVSGVIQCMQNKTNKFYWSCRRNDTSFIILKHPNEGVIFPQNVDFDDRFNYPSTHTVDKTSFKLMYDGKVVVVQKRTELQLWYGEVYAGTEDPLQSGLLCVDVLLATI